MSGISLDPRQLFLYRSSWLKITIAFRLGAQQTIIFAKYLSTRHHVISADGNHTIAQPMSKEAPTPPPRPPTRLRPGFSRCGDPHAESEAVGLIPTAVELSQSDVLSQTTRRTSLLALDVGIASQESLLFVHAGHGLEAMCDQRARVHEPPRGPMTDGAGQTGGSPERHTECGGGAVLACRVNAMWRRR